LTQRIYRKGSWITLKANPADADQTVDVNEFAEAIHRSGIEMQNLKDRLPDTDYRYYKNRTKEGYQMSFTTNFDLEDIEIIAPPKPPKEKKVAKKKERHINPPVKPQDYVLFVELGSEPGGVAVFGPSGEGTPPDTAPVVNLDFVGWTNRTRENQDPPGLVGQATNRAGWFFEPFPPPIDAVEGLDVSVHIEESKPAFGFEQIVRVDQGHTAYPGSWVNPVEVNVLLSEWFWTYQDIPYPTRWYSVDPGPPPEGLCGYSWAMWEIYSPDGDDSADFHDINHLFYAVWIGGAGCYQGGKLSYWWPPEFNQYINKGQYWHEESCLLRYEDGYTIWPGDPYQDGMEAYYSGSVIPRSFGQVDAVLNDSIRVWGIIDYWGNYQFSLNDIYESDFPFTSWTARDYLNKTTITDYMKNYDYEGTFLAGGRHLEIHLGGGYFIPLANGTWNSSGWTVWKRVEFDKSCFTTPGDLTVRQEELILGNEGSANWVYDALTDNWYAEQWISGEYGTGYMSVVAGGQIYHVYEEKVKWSNGLFADFGIFTKEHTGINEEGEVDYQDVEPLYAYAVKIGEWTGSQHDTFVINGIKYGMVVDGLSYVTEEFNYLGGGEYNIPQASEAADTDGNSILPKAKVRMGIRKSYIPEEVFTSVEEEVF
jgi:hypothetical protein